MQTAPPSQIDLTAASSRALPPSPDDLAKWLGFLALYDVVFVLVSIAVFDYLLDD